MLTWEELCERAAGHSELSDVEKADALKAYAELRAIFGDVFFETKHPLYSMFFDRSGWRCAWAVWFCELLRSFKENDEFTRLTLDIANPSCFGERLDVLLIAYVLLRGGFSITFDREIQLSTGPKKPDLFIRLDPSDEGRFIEVSSVARSAKQKEADGVFHAIQDLLWPITHELNFAGRCDRILAPKHLSEVLGKIHAAAETAKERGFGSVDIQGVVHFAFARKSNETTIRAWADALGLDLNGFQGPGAEVSESDRLTRTLRQKAEQVPTDASNIIVIYSHLFFASPERPETLQVLAQSIEEQLYSHAHVGYLIVVFEWMGSNMKGVFPWGEHLQVNCQQFALCTSYMIFRNRFAAKPIPPVVEQRFLEAFKHQALI